MTITDVANDVVAAFSGFPAPDQYMDTHAKILENLDQLEKQVAAITKVATLDNYQKADKLAGVISSVYCFAFNNQSNEFKRVSALDRTLGKKLVRFAERYGRAKSPEMRTLIKYVCWRQWFRDHDILKIAQALLQGGFLCSFAEEAGWAKTYYVTGVHFQVRDNVATVDRRGVNHFCYVRNWALQAFGTSSKWHTFLSEMEADGKINVPSLPPHYQRTYFGNYRNSARLSFTWKEAGYITNKYLMTR